MQVVPSKPNGIASYASEYKRTSAHRRVSASMTIGENQRKEVARIRGVENGRHVVASQGGNLSQEKERT